MSPLRLLARLPLPVLRPAAGEIFLFPGFFPAGGFPCLSSTFLFTGERGLGGGVAAGSWAAALGRLPILVSLDQDRLEVAEAVENVLSVL